MRRLTLSLGLALTIALPCAAQPAPRAAPAKATQPTMLSVKDVMRHIVNPAAETYWKHTGAIDSEEGTNDRTPTSKAEWSEMAHAAAQVQEAGNLLAMDGRGRDQGLWLKYAKALTDAGALAFAAVQAQDHDRVFDAGGEIYNACFNCHGRYIQRPKNSLYRAPLPGD